MSASPSDERASAVRHAQRAAGQVSGLAGMIAADQPFPELAQQLFAARGSLDALLVRLVDLELRSCVPNRDVRDEVDGLLRTALGRRAGGRAVATVAPLGAGTPAGIGPMSTKGTSTR